MFQVNCKPLQIHLKPQIQSQGNFSATQLKLSTKKCSQPILDYGKLTWKWLEPQNGPPVYIHDNWIKLQDHHNHHGWKRNDMIFLTSLHVLKVSCPGGLLGNGTCLVTIIELSTWEPLYFHRKVLGWLVDMILVFFQFIVYCDMHPSLYEILCM